MEEFEEFWRNALAANAQFASNPLLYYQAFLEAYLERLMKATSLIPPSMSTGTEVFGLYTAAHQAFLAALTKPQPPR